MRTAKDIQLIEIGHRFRHFRNKAGYSQDDMATLLGVTLKTYQRIENNKGTMINLVLLSKCLKIFQTDLKTFFNF